MSYDHREPTTFTLSELEGFVGYKGTLPLTGRFVEAREGPNGGCFVLFEVDERWGVGPLRLGFDMEAFTGVSK